MKAHFQGRYVSLSRILSAILSFVLLVTFTPRDTRAQSPSCGNELISVYHVPQCNESGKLIPWNIDAAGPFDYIMKIEAQWWLNAPNVSGWPAYLTGAELNKSYFSVNGALPAATVAMAIEAYLKYYAYTGDAAYLNMLRTMGDYIIQNGLTPDTYVAYPKFPWPVGQARTIPPDGSGVQNNTAGNIMPDKGAMIGIALLHLYEATGNLTYLDESIHIADVLAVNALPGTVDQSPWPFRAEADSGANFFGPISGNQVFALRLYDELIRLGITGNGMYQSTRDNVWDWLKNVAIADTTGEHWQHFFEDLADADNPTQFDALEMARYLLEQKDALDPDWFSMAGSLIDLVKSRWVVHSGDYTAIGEQQGDMFPYNSHTPRYASILSKYFELGGPPEYKDEAYSSFAYSTYSVGFDGFADTSFNVGLAWATDSFGDWMQHYMDGLAAVPEWGPNSDDHLLRSTSIVQSITYGSNAMSYTTFDSTGQEKLKLTFSPTRVTVDGSPINDWTWDSSSHVLIINRSSGTSVAVFGPSFSVSPQTQTVAQGNSTTYTITRTGLSDPNESVSLSVTGLPNDTTAAFNPASITGAGSSVLTVTTSSNTAAGLYTLDIQVTSASGTVHANPRLIVTNTSSQLNTTIFPPTTVPTQSAENGTGLELGVKFRSDVSGFIEGIRFYKGPTDTSPHTGSLWSSTGERIATATFTHETQTGWQQAQFDSPVAIAANTTYTASYHTSSSFFINVNYFQTGVDSPPLHALRDGIDGPNGVYTYSGGGDYPNQTYSSSNYWVDVAFSSSGGSSGGGGGGSGPQSISAITGALQSALVGTAFGAPLQARVSDSALNPVAGVTVTFSAPASGASATFNGNSSIQTITNALGIATAPAPVANGIAGEYSVLASLPNLATSATFTLTNTAPASSSTNTTIFPAGTIPTQSFGNDSAVELGVKFRSDVNGFINGIRFYKGPTDTSVHTGSLWSTTGQLIATGTFTNETSGGWQEMDFSSPVPITANMTYTASYHTNSSFYATFDYFSIAADSPPLHALKDGFSGPNGVYTYSSGGVYPTQTYQATNYWVDVAFAPAGSGGSGGSGPIPQTMIAISGILQDATIGTAFPSALQARVTDFSSNPVAGVTVTFNAPASGASATFNGSRSIQAITNALGVATTPIPVANTTTGAYNVVASVANLSTTAAFALNNTAASGSTTNSTIFSPSTTPTQSFGNGSGVELGVKFRSDVNGFISGIRFYKGPSDTSLHTGSLWSSTGQLLASGTFTNETASGWQQLQFSSPVAITANTTYTGSYHTSGPFYANFDYFHTSVDTPPLHALQDGFDGPNGVYTYSGGGVFPNQTYQATNYWVDVVLTSSGGSGGGGGSDPQFITAFSGTLQSATVNTVFGSTLQARVTDNSSNPVAGVTVTFSAPATGASAILNGSNSAQALTDASGIATSPVPVANTVAGGYNVLAFLPNMTTSASFTLTNTANNGGNEPPTVTIFSPNTVPPQAFSNSAGVELGVKFRSDVNGVVKGIRFYKGTTDNSVHTGSLWSSTGQLLATAVFTNESSSGWQQVEFSTPVAITANTTYVASYHTSSSFYANFDYFNTGVDNSPLHALRNGVDGANGVYIYSGGGVFPDQTYTATNYWVDVVFASQ